MNAGQAHGPARRGSTTSKTTLTTETDSSETDADLVGGRLRPPPEVRLPDWYQPDTMSGILAQIEWGDEPFEL